MIGKYIKETFKNLKRNKKDKILTNKKGIIDELRLHKHKENKKIFW
mgnify:CR=1 FL=1